MAEIAAVLKDISGLVLCGKAVYSCFRDMIFVLSRDIEDATWPADLCADADQVSLELLVLANEKIQSYPYREVPVHWRQLYTDAILLKALVASRRVPSESRQEELNEAIRLLDMAIIVSGAPGIQRETCLFALLKTCQQAICGASSMEVASEPTRPQKCQRMLSVKSHPSLNALSPLRPPDPPVTREIPTFDRPPSLASFLSTRSRSPFVIRGVCKDWPASTDHSWNDLDYLLKIAGPGRVVPVEVGGDYTHVGWGQQIVPWVEFLNSLGVPTHNYETKKGRPILYLAQHDLFRQFPALRDDVIIPDYVYALSGEAPDYAPNYHPPTNRDALIINAWLGPVGTVSPAHTDPYHNCYAQVVGRKYVWVAPPDCGPAMYCFGSRNQDKPEDASQPAGSHSDYMDNTSRIDVIESMFKDPAKSERLEQRFPGFTEVQHRAMQAVLENGDLLYIPPGWWHSMKSLECSFSVSMWF